MESLVIIIDNKKYDPHQDVWVDGFGHIFIQNKHYKNVPVFIDITTERWIFKILGVGQEFIDWNEIGLPRDIESAFKLAVAQQLRHRSYRYPKHCRLMLLEFKALLKSGCASLSELQMSDINMIWQNMKPANRPYLRTLYTILANQNIGGACQTIATKLKGMNARNEEIPLKHVLNWNETKGALTQEEETQLRNAIEACRSSDIRHFGAKLFCRLLMETLKRGKQIRELQLNCLKVVENNGVRQYFVLIKPVKHQTGDPERWWPISEALYSEMQRYSALPSVHALQKSYDRFLVLDCPSMRRNGVIGADDAKQALVEYVKKTLKLISPRTRKALHLTPNRIRHTGATRLAFQGVARDIIAEILEHDDPNSCQAYIDAIGSELCPVLDKADRNMGSLFRQLNHTYFKGKIIDDLIDPPIMIPEFSDPTSTPLFVGSCTRNTSKEGLCHKHPFVSCYNGCSSFLAWSEADHQRGLNYAEREIERWRKANGNGNAKQASVIKEYEELKYNILEVIENIARLKEAS